jgi:hypothetical protein
VRRRVAGVPPPRPDAPKHSPHCRTVARLAASFPDTPAGRPTGSGCRAGSGSGCRTGSGSGCRTGSGSGAVPAPGRAICSDSHGGTLRRRSGARQGRGNSFVAVFIPSCAWRGTRSRTRARSEARGCS